MLALRASNKYKQLPSKFIISNQFFFLHKDLNLLTIIQDYFGVGNIINMVLHLCNIELVL